MWTVSTAPLANPHKIIIGKVGSHINAVTGDTFKSLFATSQDLVAVMRIVPSSPPLARYSPSGENKTTDTELECPESFTVLSYL